MSAPFSPVVEQLFTDLRHAGLAPDAGAAMTAIFSDKASGARLRLQRGGAGEPSWRFEAHGCPDFLAACEAACRALERGETAVDAMELIRELAIPIEKAGRILLIEDAWRSLPDGGTQR